MVICLVFSNHVAVVGLLGLGFTPYTVHDATLCCCQYLLKTSPHLLQELRRVLKRYRNVARTAKPRPASHEQVMAEFSFLGGNFSFNL